MSVLISLSRVHFPVTTLGPGRRLGIWFQGCSIRCPGCISTDTWASRTPDTTVAALVNNLENWIGVAEGFTISGGEPFEQPTALAELVQALRERSSADILVYTGYSIEAVQALLHEFEGLIDALISDPFSIELPQTKRLRGSDNQRLWCLTELGRERFEDYDQFIHFDKRSLDMGIDANGEVWMVGIPQRGDMKRLEEILEASGHRVKISGDRSWIAKR